MIKKTASAILAALMCITGASAKNLSFSIDSANKKAAVTAQTQDGISGKRYKLIILKPDKNPEEITSDNINDYIQYIYQGEASENGVITHLLPFDGAGASGYYTARLIIENEAEEEAALAYFATDADGDALARELTEYGMTENPVDYEAKALYIKNALSDEQKRRILGADETFYNDITDIDALCLILAKSNFAPKRTAFCEEFSKAVLLCALNEGIKPKTVLEYYAPILGYSDLNTYKKYLSYSDNEKIVMKGKNLKSMSDVTDALAFELISAKTADITRWEQSVNVLKEFEDELGIDYTTYNKMKNKDKAVKTYLAADKSSLSDIESEFESAAQRQYKKECEEKDNKPSGGGGSGSGGTSNVTITPSEKPIKPEKTDKPEKPEKTVELSDISGHWAQKAIESLISKKIVSGYEDNTFKPDEKITRAQFIKLLTEAFDIPETERMGIFPDVQKSDWSYSYINRAFYAKIIKGSSDGGICPDNNITRQEICTILGRCLETKGIALSKIKDSGFSDFDEISDYARSYVGTLADAGIINGMGGGKFEPLTESTRAQAAKIIYEILNTAEETK